MINIIAVGKKHDPNITDAINDYEKRLRAPFEVKWVLLPYSAKNGDEARQDESERIISQLRPADFVVLLDERGQDLSSPDFSALLTSQQNIVIIIGGAYGVNDELRQRADRVISLSAMVFPHQLVRLVIIEQIYRAQAIATNHPYHHS
ncbi:MAG TPA: 23S rRNA (pseudouridine(1915)-N(3))-methyltransferase RlmH [Candidatus Nanoperiomorbaceae bacterium]|jgi:23S rRNA (pseudouridine1915-N3)-methyltransferase|nr:MAG: 23S rRNA (pseudouridine(1915)-N(3))-methyltransferase RlmH [Candidatus Saccharibacteria bacterium]HMQ09322.1 23S rRNA (pseudouridine(1915)-N(3))-methyltransferase RlmH [Candidatus Nanoperiomorbaceae bacterium]HMQ96645.1 23S rRNA (pseudouridine(1915)-N(3))-methyltransferase RlmH [Candidatus Nanoperiomorbaceae bacterium]